MKALLERAAQALLGASLLRESSERGAFWNVNLGSRTRVLGYGG